MHCRAWICRRTWYRGTSRAKEPIPRRGRGRRALASAHHHHPHDAHPLHRRPCDARRARGRAGGLCRLLFLARRERQAVVSGNIPCPSQASRPLLTLCQDCRAVEEAIQNTFAAADGPAALIVWVGQKPECVCRGGALGRARSKALRSACLSCTPLTVLPFLQMEEPVQPVQSPAVERRIDSDCDQSQGRECLPPDAAP